MRKNSKIQALTQKLLLWYQENRIAYSWRKTRDPYSIWLSEILLQQTRISVAIGFYERILAQYPTIQDLVGADSEAFVSSWSGIGYYSRARNMIACAREIVAAHGGIFPSELKDLLKLSGIGPYTAGALRNICFDKLSPAIDGNIRRVLARITGNRNPAHSRTFHREIEAAFLRLGKNAPAGDYFQALMELGEQICLPVPDCPSCPLQKACYAGRHHAALEIPRPKSKKKTEVFHWYFLPLSRKDKSRFYVLNPERAFLKGAWMFPDILSQKELNVAALKENYKRIWGIELKKISADREIRHSITFRRIHGHVLHADQYRLLNGKGKWLTMNELKRYPTSSITHKILKTL